MNSNKLIINKTPTTLITNFLTSNSTALITDADADVSMLIRISSVEANTLICKVIYNNLSADKASKLSTLSPGQPVYYFTGDNKFIECGVVIAFSGKVTTTVELFPAQRGAEGVSFLPSQILALI